MHIEICPSCSCDVYTDDLGQCLVCGAVCCHRCPGCSHTAEEEHTHHRHMEMGAALVALVGQSYPWA